MDKVKIGEILMPLINEGVTIKEKPKFSEKKNKIYAGKNGILRLVSLGDPKETPIVQVEMEVIIKSKKEDRIDKTEVWFDAVDIVGVD